jgi:hypothetical protein
MLAIQGSTVYAFQVRKVSGYLWVFPCCRVEPNLARVTENLLVSRIKSFLCLGHNSVLWDVCSVCPGVTMKRERHKASSKPYYVFAGRSWINRLHTDIWIIRRGLIRNSWNNWRLWISYNAERKGGSMLVVLNRIHTHLAVPMQFPAMPFREGFILCLLRLIYTVRKCLIHTCHAVPMPFPCRSPAIPRICRSKSDLWRPRQGRRRGTAWERHGVCVN